MLYVFQVDHGKSMAYDTRYAVERVSRLKKLIQEEYKIEAETQVFLTSAGEILENNMSVCAYPIGTDTNPIFLYSRKIIDTSIMPPDAIRALDMKEQEMLRKIGSHLNMPANFSTVSKRSNLAQELYAVANNQLSECYKLIHEQHLQYQGWKAVLANLDINILDFDELTKPILRSFTIFMRESEHYFNFLNQYDGVISTLKRIPILNVLLKLSDDNQSTSQETESGKALTLYSWILTTDASVVERVRQICSKSLEEFDNTAHVKLSTDVDKLMNTSRTSRNRDSTDLNEKLSSLEPLCRDLRGLVGQQNDLAQAFEKNQLRASTTKDTSVLPDLCLTHKEQLQMMQNNHKMICDILRSCMKAKEELTALLHVKLNWVTQMQDDFCSTYHKVMVHQESFNRVDEHWQLLRQFQDASSTYLSTVTEVVRRKQFSNALLMSANHLARKFSAIYKEEVTRRQQFSTKFKNHLLKPLFPGMDDLPPPFATRAPRVFDAGLPHVTEEDVEWLKRELPDLAEKLEVPNIPVDLLSIKVKDDEEEPVLNVNETKAVIKELVEAATNSEIELASDLEGSLLKDDFDRECVSECGSEDFENVCQSSLPSLESPSPLPHTQDASTITEETLEIFRSENDKLKSVLLKLYQLVKEETSQLKNEMGDIRSTVLLSKDLMSQECRSLGNSWENVIVERDTKERETLEITKKCHEAAMDNLRRQDEEKTKQVELLSCEKLSLESEVLKSCQDLKELRENIDRINDERAKTIHALQKRVKEVEVEKEKDIKEITDKLNREHKEVMERIRYHLKFMTMEQSTFDTSSERSEDFASLPAGVFLQMKENFELNKEKAVNEALLAEREKWKKLLEKTVRETETRCLEETNKLLSSVPERNEEIEYYRTREIETKNQTLELMNRIRMLEREKNTLESELEELKGEDMATSDYEGKVDATTSPIKQKDFRSEIPSSRSGKVSIDSCKPGDLVVVVWEPAHESFKIVQENKHMFFLHSDYLVGLGLEIVDGKPNKSYIVGEVVDKEYCFARKSENRYKVPKRTKFFRVKVKPYVPPVSSKNVTQSLYQPKSAGMDTSGMTLSQRINPISEELKRDEVDMPGMTMSQYSSAISEYDSGPASLPSSPSTHPTILERDEPDTTITNVIADNLDPVTVHEVECVQTTFAEDSGIVENVEEAMAALDATLTTEIRNNSESSDR